MLDEQIKCLALLATIDHQIHAIRKTQEEVPVRIDELQREDATELTALEEKKARRDEMNKRRRELERELAEVEQKIAADQEKEMMVRTNEELHALQRGVKTARKRQDEIEEKILVLMEEMGDFEKEVHRAEKRYAEFHGKHAGEIGELEARLEKENAQLESLLAEREESAAKLDGDTRVRYQGLENRGLVPVVARAAGGICTGCHSTVQPQLYNQIITAMEIFTCPHCSRLLIYIEEAE